MQFDDLEPEFYFRFIGLNGLLINIIGIIENSFKEKDFIKEFNLESDYEFIIKHLKDTDEAVITYRINKSYNVSFHVESKYMLSKRKNTFYMVYIIIEDVSIKAE